jgi:NADPH-dependent curcumin reductase CurA
MKIGQMILSSRPVGVPTTDNFRFEEKVIESIKENEVLLKSMYISVDPYMRGRMNESKSYAKPYEINQPVKGGIVATVLESRSSLFSTGDVVTGTLPWATHIVEDAKNLDKVEKDSTSPSYYLGILGMPGLTAYFGMMDIGNPKKGETVVVSGAAGAVGLVAGQIAGIMGCKVVGIAGTDEKCRLLKEDFGFNAVINYREAKSIKKSIASTCPDGVDVYFDNVGGFVTEGVMSNLNFHSRVVVCGQISQYNNTRIQLVPDILPRVLTRSIMVKGFIVRNYNERFEEGQSHLSEWLKEGKIKYKETIINGFDKLPEAFLGLFSGNNIGKMLVRIE